MRALIHRTLIIHLSSPFRSSSIFSFHSFSSNSELPSSPPSSSHSYYVPRRNYDEENRSIKVTVWWDFENCHVPAGVSVERVANRITQALRSTGIKGPVTITAFGDVSQMSRSTQEALTATGVCLNHVPHGGKNSSDRSFMADLVYWVTQNPPPSHFFLISSDKDFANILHRLRMSNYNILLASVDPASGVLCSAATIMWPWTALAKGENVVAKHFNHPPDGFYGSWYGQYKGALEDPLADSEQCAISQAEESMEKISETKIRSIPRVVLNGIRNVLHSYPEGMYISELRSELRRKNVPLDKDLYGHKKFTDLLASLPSIVKFIRNPSGNGQPLVADSRVAISVEPSSEPVAVETQTSKLEGNSTSPGDEIPLPVAAPSVTFSLSPSIIKDIEVHINAGVCIPIPADNIVAEGKELKRTDITAEPTPTPVHNVVAEGKKLKRTGIIVEPTPVPVENVVADEVQDTEVKDGFIGRLWTFWNGPRSDQPVITKDIKCGEVSGSCKEVKSEHSKKLRFNEKIAEPKHSSLNAPSSSSDLNSSKSVPEVKTATQSEKNNSTSDLRIGFFSRLANWWQSWKSGAKGEEDITESDTISIDANAKCAKDLNLMRLTETHALFSSSQFWDDLESFLNTTNAADLILKSSTRDQLAHRLQNEGPSNLKDLKESHLLKLVELLILERRWVEESAPKTFPFKLTLPAKRRCTSSNAHGSNGLSSLFGGKSTQRTQQQGNGSIEGRAPQNLAELRAWFQQTCSNSTNIGPEDFKKLFESKFNKELVCSFYGFSTVRTLLVACLTSNNYTQGRQKPTPNREEVLSDCHKLLAELFKAHPHGFNMSNFRPAFYQKYGYVLDFQKLGYPKLVSLLQIMPGVKVESTFILPASLMSGSDSNLSNGSSEEWEELGPVSDASVGNNNKSQTSDDKQMSYSRVSLSDEEFTDSDDDSPADFDVSKKKPKRGDEDSSLLQILDSWYTNQEGGGGGGKDRNQNSGELVDCSKSNSANTPDLKAADSIKSNIRPQRRYSFVAESGDDEKDKLVDSIMGRRN